jgi:hypothetical protein
MSMGERMSNMFSKEGLTSMGQSAMEAKNMIPMAVSMGQQNQWDLEDMNNQLGLDAEANAKEEYDRAQRNLQGAYAGAQPGIRRGRSPYRNQMSRNTPGMSRYAEGGLVQGYGMGGRVSPYDDDWPSYGRGRSYGGYKPGEGYGSTYGGIDPVEVQANLRGRHNISSMVPPNYMAGFSPEIDYFQNNPNPETPDDPNFTPNIPRVTYSNTWDQMYRWNPIGNVGDDGMPQGGTSSYFNSILPIPAPQAQPAPTGNAKSGKEQLHATGGQVLGLAAGGIADVEVPQNFQAPNVNPGAVMPGLETPQPQPIGAYQEPMPPMPEDPAEVEMVIQAIKGEVENADAVINDFINKYGIEVFQQLREHVLNPTGGAQTEGLLQGPGGGMDDQIRGSIAGGDQVAVSPGEFIVPADVVSGLGDGDTNAGAQQLDGMMNNVRAARQGGIVAQPQPIDARKYLPA